LIASSPLQHVAATAFEDAVIRESSHQRSIHGDRSTHADFVRRSLADRLAAAAMLVRMLGLEIAR
jgi:hypothetical protein